MDRHQAGDEAVGTDDRRRAEARSLLHRLYRAATEAQIEWEDMFTWDYHPAEPET